MSSEPSQRRSSLLTGVVLALALMPFQAALASAQVLSAASDLSAQSESLRSEVDRFLASVRAA